LAEFVEILADMTAVKETLKDAVAVAKTARTVEVERYCSRRESRLEIRNKPRTRATHPYSDRSSLKKWRDIRCVDRPSVMKQGSTMNAPEFVIAIPADKSNIKFSLNSDADLEEAMVQNLSIY
jgi:hypothetical protein